MLVSPIEVLNGSPSARVLVDCRHDLLDHDKGRRAYEQGHLPGAYFVPVETALAGPKTGKNGRHPLPTPAAFARFLAETGISSETRVIAYDDAGGLYAARFWWMARALGIKNAALLDGGVQGWIAAGGALSTEPPPRPPASVPVRAPDDWPGIASSEEIAAGLGSPKMTIVDARAAERFRGDSETIDPVAGHIPGARNHFYRHNLTADLRFRPAEELRALWNGRLAGRTPDTVIHQCGSGITACANLFAMELAGLSGSRLHPGSWSEWVSDPSRPVARGD